CYITEISNSTDDIEVSIARARVEPGVTTKLHCLKEVTERYVILDGEGLVEIDSTESYIVAVGDVVIIPPMCSQKITNTGAVDLMFLAICTPRFSKDCYQEQ
ncbi:MAG: cupin domain-containing protein, partial [Gammaproteobacteria bacterium]